jgi:hypothetical protein
VTCLTVFLAAIIQCAASTTAASLAANPRSLTMTVVRTETFRQIAATLAVAIFLAALAGPCYSFTAEAQRQCTGDAFRLCSSEIPNISRITACMVRNRSSLSSGCRIELDKGLAMRSHRVAEQ